MSSEDHVQSCRTNRTRSVDDAPGITPLTILHHRSTACHPTILCSYLASRSLDPQPVQRLATNTRAYGRTHLFALHRLLEFDLLLLLFAPLLSFSQPKPDLLLFKLNFYAHYAPELHGLESLLVSGSYAIGDIVTLRDWKDRTESSAGFSPVGGQAVVCMRLRARSLVSRSLAWTVTHTTKSPS